MIPITSPEWEQACMDLVGSVFWNRMEVVRWFVENKYAKVGDRVAWLDSDLNLRVTSMQDYIDSPDTDTWD